VSYHPQADAPVAAGHQDDAGHVAPSQIDEFSSGTDVMVQWVPGRVRSGRRTRPPVTTGRDVAH
jgi:hypothetical protein